MIAASKEIFRSNNSNSKIKKLTRQANDLHIRCQRLHKETVWCFKQAGDVLLEIKLTLPKRKWLQWVEKEFDGTRQTANNYMRIAENWEAIKPLWEDGEVTTLRKALAALKQKTEPLDDSASVLLVQLEAVTPGLADRGFLDPTDHFIFSDGEVWTFNDRVACRTPCSLKDISGAVEAQSLLRLLRSLRGQQVEFSTTESRLQLTVSDMSRYQMPLDRAVSIHPVPLPEPDEWLALPADFRDAIKSVARFASKDSAEEQRSCVHIHPNWIEASNGVKWDPTIAGTQAARYEISIPIDAPIRVHATAIHHLGEVPVVEFAVKDKWIHFRDKNGFSISCRVEGKKYPDLSSLLEKDGGTSLTFPASVKRSIDRLKTIWSGNGVDRNLFIEVSPGRGSISAHGSCDAFGCEHFRLDYSGERLCFVSDIVPLMDWVGRDKPCTVSKRKIRYEDGKFTHVVLMDYHQPSKGKRSQKSQNTCGAL